MLYATLNTAWVFYCERISRAHKTAVNNILSVNGLHFAATVYAAAAEVAASFIRRSRDLGTTSGRTVGIVWYAVD